MLCKACKGNQTQEERYGGKEESYGDMVARKRDMAAKKNPHMNMKRYGVVNL
ncbi:hypothetical protein A2U01_0056174 [Trifolium medium]|uniref:Uncharacterized protein n=1 Tax=Trifolium medium TaxID=97028 RepID=A0A392RE94_9FABA|nr:hypothetical protein [Trifolium medium]